MEVRDDCLYSLLGIGKSVVKNNRVDVVEIIGEKDGKHQEETRDPDGTVRERFQNILLGDLIYSNRNHRSTVSGMSHFSWT